MKKLIFIIFSLLLVLIIKYKDNNESYLKVWEITSPIEIYIDYNNNFIFDEKEPYKIKNIIYISKDSDLNSCPLLKNLSKDEKFFIEFFQNKIAKETLFNKYITIKKGNLYVKNKLYKSILMDSGWFCDETEESQEKLYNKIKSINLKDFVIYNTSSKKYHEISCEEGQSSRKFIIIERKKLNKEASQCKICMSPNKINLGIKNKLFNFTEVYKDSNIKIYFLDLNKIFKPEQTCNTKACKTLKQEIDNAKKSIDFSIYGLNNQPEIIKALINAKNRGVKIRWVTDYSPNTDRNDIENLKQLLPNCVTDIDIEQNNSSALMHNKFFIFDNKKIWTGTANITSTDLTGFNANYTIIINSEEAAKIYLQEFNQMYNGYFHNRKEKINHHPIIFNNDSKLEIYFSPKDKIITSKIIPLINNAKNNINIAIFFMTNNDMKTALINAHKRGVKIKILNDSTNSHNKYTIHKELRKNKIQVKTENYAGKMHIKSMTIDNNISIIGSMNFTKSAEIRNDENVLIIRNEKITKYLNDNFNYLWSKIPNKYLYYDVKAESLESIGSCFDGIDNDFDEKIDIEDEGCIMKE